MKKQFLFFLFCLCAGVSNVWAQETDWSPLFTRVCEGVTYTCENDEAYPWKLANGCLISTTIHKQETSTCYQDEQQADRPGCRPFAAPTASVPPPAGERTRLCPSPMGCSIRGRACWSAGRGTFPAAPRAGSPRPGRRGMPAHTAGAFSYDHLAGVYAPRHKKIRGLSATDFIVRSHISLGNAIQ